MKPRTSFALLAFALFAVFCVSGPSGAAPPSGAGPLTQVTHDSTLTGQGTTASQLGVAKPLNLNGSGTVLTTTSTSTGGVGASLQAAGHNGAGVIGVGGASGVYGESLGDDDNKSMTNGVYGFTQGTEGAGVRGVATLPAATGVRGEGVEGVVGESNGNGLHNVGVYGIAHNGLAGRFDGDVRVSGILDMTPSTGIILKATDGPNCFRVTVDNTGSLTTSAVSCPPAP